MANIVPGSAVALEGMPPTEELLAGIVYLPPALVHPLRGAVVAYVVGNTEDEGLNLYRDGYYTVFPSQGPGIFWLSCRKIVEATLWAWMGLRKRTIKQEGNGQGTTFESML